MSLCHYGTFCFLQKMFGTILPLHQWGEKNGLLYIKLMLNFTKSFTFDKKTEWSLTSKHFMHTPGYIWSPYRVYFLNVSDWTSPLDCLGMCTLCLTDIYLTLLALLYLPDKTVITSFTGAQFLLGGRGFYSISTVCGTQVPKAALCFNNKIP